MQVQFSTPFQLRLFAIWNVPWLARENLNQRGETRWKREWFVCQETNGRRGEEGLKGGKGSGKQLPIVLTGLCTGSTVSLTCGQERLGASLYYRYWTTPNYWMLWRSLAKEVLHPTKAQRWLLLLVARSLSLFLLLSLSFSLSLYFSLSFSFSPFLLTFVMQLTITVQLYID